MRQLRILAVAVLTLLIGGPVWAGLIQNGSFEQGLDPGGFTTLSEGSTAIVSWNVVGTIDYIGTYWQAQDGQRSLDLNGNSNGGVWQEFATAPGTTYRVSFFLSGNPDGGPLLKQVNVSVNDQGLQTYSFVLGGSRRDSMNWTAFDYTFQAGGTTTKLLFRSENADGDDQEPCCYGPALDNVSVTVVPDGGSTMWVLGATLAALGVARRLRRF